MNDLINANDQTMSSIEISKLTGKNHADVRRDIEKTLTDAGIDISKYADVSINQQNQKVKVYNLPRFECDLVVSGYSVKYRAAIIKRWHELERQKEQPLSLEEMTVKVIQGQQKKIEAQ